MKNKWVTTLLGIGLIAVVVITSAFLIKNKPVPPKNEARETVLYVKTLPVTYEEANFKTTYHGRVQTAETVSLSAEVSGKIMHGEVPLKEGERFSKGQLLVRIYHKDAQAALQSVRSNFLQLLSSVLPDIKVDYPKAYDAWYQFFTSISISEDLPELPDFTSQTERVFLASRGILTQYYTIKQQEITFQKYNLYAPFNGAYKQVNKQVGAVAGMNAELARLIRTDALEVVVPVLPEHRQWIRSGMIVELTTKSGEQVQGRVARMANFVDPTNQSVNSYIAVRGVEAQKLLEGEYVDATFTSRSAIEAMELPRVALLDDESVYMVKEGKLVKQKVRVEAYLKDDVLLTGLEAGGTVVSESLIDVKEGQKVKPIEK
ncbi:MAG: efflux RND transporter periplasmic adaptor subunit [Bacteroidota bacterium]